MVAQRTQLSTAYLSHTSAALVLELDMFSQEPDVYLAVSCAPNQVHTVLPRIWVPARGTPALISEGPSDSSGCRAGAQRARHRRLRAASLLSAGPGAARAVLGGD